MKAHEVTGRELIQVMREREPSEEPEVERLRGELAVSRRWAAMWKEIAKDFRRSLLHTDLCDRHGNQMIWLEEEP